MPGKNGDGGLHAIDILDPDVYVPFSSLCYFHNFILEFKKNGYTAGETLFGFGYDFRCVWQLVLQCAADPNTLGVADMQLDAQAIKRESCKAHAGHGQAHQPAERRQQVRHTWCIIKRTFRGC